MLINIIRAGGYIMIFNELANRINKIRHSRTTDVRRNRTRNLIIGAGIGSAVGVAAGILFAPKSGADTRKAIADQTSQTIKNLKDNVVETKDRIFAASTQKKSRSQKTGEKSDETANETSKK
jgi:gas vesicle protein